MPRKKRAVDDDPDHIEQFEREMQSGDFSAWDCDPTRDIPSSTSSQAKTHVPSYVQDCIAGTVEELADDTDDTDCAELPVRAYALGELFAPTVAAVEVVNTLAVITMHGRLDLMLLVSRCRRYGASFDPEQFLYLLFRFDDPLCTVMVFATGKIMALRAKRPQHARHAAKYVVDIIRNVDVDGQRPYHNLAFDEPKILNLVGKYKAPFRVDVQRLESEVPDARADRTAFYNVSVALSKLDPQHFGRSKAVGRIFADGGCTVMGCRRASELLQAQSVLFELMLEYMRVPMHIKKKRLQSAQHDLERSRDDRFLFLPVDADDNEAAIRVRQQNGTLVRHAAQHSGLEIVGANNALALHTEARVHAEREAQREASFEKRTPTSINIIEGRDAVALARMNDENMW